MIAAIYARKSTEQNGVGDKEKSVTRQIEHAKTYATKKGWVVAEDYVYVDDGISGAEFVKRPGFLRLMNALKPKPPFQVLIMSEESRLGREQIETAYALKQIITAGVRVVYYLEDRERTLESPTDKLLLSVTAFADEMEREKARQRTHDALVRKARAGYVAGGSVYGYDNGEVTVPDTVTGKPKRLHVERRINEIEAAIIREIFEKAAAGWGTRRIAHDLNARGVPAPPPTTSRTTACLGTLDPLRHADSIPVPRRGRLEPEPQAKRLGYQAPDRAGPGGMGPTRDSGIADRPRAALAGGPGAVSGYAGVVPSGDQRAAVGPSRQWHRVPLPPDRAGPVRPLRRKPHRAQPSVWGSPSQCLPVQLPSPAREHGLSRRAGPPDGSE
jgi:DNA invertase Pin-like site-specific DNA recombinase